MSCFAVKNSRRDVYINARRGGGVIFFFEGREKGEWVAASVQASFRSPTSPRPGDQVLVILIRNERGCMTCAVAVGYSIN